MRYSVQRRQIEYLSAPIFPFVESTARDDTGIAEKTAIAMLQPQRDRSCFYSTRVEDGAGYHSSPV
jgi:hypothetical protein